VFTDQVHLQMLSLLGMKGDLQGIKKLIEKLGKEPRLIRKN
jgi:hypothetical protein